MTGLQRLLVDERTFDQEALATALDGLMLIGSAGSIRPGPRWQTLNRRARVIAVLLAAKAAWALDVRPDDLVKPVDIANQTGIPGGTVRPLLRTLHKEGLLENEGGRYRVAPMALIDAIAELQGGD